jgi:hypothetical protein
VTGPELYFVQEAIIALSGEVAEARARRGSEPGWTKYVSEGRRRGVHEAAHAICAASLARYVLGLTIVPDEQRRSRSGRYFSGGRCTYSSKPTQEIENRAPEELITDRSRIAKAALALALAFPDDSIPCWMNVRRIIRALKQATAALVEEHWYLIQGLASELERSKDMDKLALERYLSKVPAARVDFEFSPST